VQTPMWAPMTVQTVARKRKSWAQSLGEYGHRIRIFEDPLSGILYAEMRDVARPGHYRTVSLRHKDRARALEWGHSQVAKWMSGDDVLRKRVPTAAHVFALYLKNQSPTKCRAEQQADARRVKMWTFVLGPAKDLSKLGMREWQGFIDARRSGAINAKGKPVLPEKRRIVRDGTVAAELTFLLGVLNWSAKWRTDDDHYLMAENPARGYPIPAERNPRRPVVTEDRYRKVFAVAPQVMMVVGRGKNRRSMPSYLAALLPIANGTGHRISAILALQYQNLRLSDGPHGSIYWPAETDKMRKSWTVPISVEVRAAINAVLAERPGIGAAFLFPDPSDPSKPIPIEAASEWLVAAEKLAGVEKHDGSLWHAYRRKWASERRGMPLPDVAAAGGWSDTSTLLNVYQQADAETMYWVVSEPSKLMERVTRG
jgi:integrase